MQRSVATGVGVLLFVVVLGLLFGPANLRHEPQSAEAVLLIQVKLLHTSDAGASDFGFSSPVSSVDLGVESTDGR